jgi:hypothetical protein
MAELRQRGHLDCRVARRFFRPFRVARFNDHQKGATGMHGKVSDKSLNAVR